MLTDCGVALRHLPVSLLQECNGLASEHMHEGPHYRLRRLVSSHPFESSSGSEGDSHVEHPHNNAHVFMVTLFMTRNMVFLKKVISAAAR